VEDRESEQFEISFVGCNFYMGLMITVLLIFVTRAWFYIMSTFFVNISPFGT
jgi:hypothetical protein